MDILITCDENLAIASNSINRIMNNCDNVLRLQIENSPIVITDENDAIDYISNSFSGNSIDVLVSAYNDGLGAVINNIFINGTFNHLIVINFANCLAIELNEQSIDGTISHELGHIFNQYVEQPIPSIIKGATKNQIEEVRAQNKRNKECYADYFSRHLGTTEGLIQSINSFMNSDLCINQDLFNERLFQLENNEVLTGRMMQLRQQPN